MMGPGFGYGYHMFGGGPGLFGGLMMFVFWLLVIGGIAALVIWLVRGSQGHGHHLQHVPPVVAPTTPGHDEAVAIAKRRLASGEITAEQYGEIMRTLHS